MVKKSNLTKKYSWEWRINTWQQGARREAGAVILSSNPHLICMLGKKKTLRKAIEQVSGKPLKVWWGLWKVLRLGRLDLHNFSLLIDFTLLPIFFIGNLAPLCSLCGGNVISVTVQTYFCVYLPFLGGKSWPKACFPPKHLLASYIWYESQIKKQNVNDIVNKHYSNTFGFHGETNYITMNTWKG